MWRWWSEQIGPLWLILDTVKRAVRFSFFMLGEFDRMLEQDVRLGCEVCAFLRREEKRREEHISWPNLGASAIVPLLCSRTKAVSFAVSGPDVNKGAASAISIVTRNCMAVWGPGVGDRPCELPQVREP